MTKNRWLTALALSAALCMASVWADSWNPATTKQNVSSNGEWRLTVTPRDITSPLDYFEDKVAERPNAGGVPGSDRTSALGKMEHTKEGRWSNVWEKPLVNEVSPVDAVVSNSGQVVTFDNWHSMGHGKNAVAVYDATGILVRAMALDDFLPKDYVRALPRSVSSINWRGTPRMSDDGNQLVVPVVVPRPGEHGLPVEDKNRYVDIVFVLNTGKRVEESGPAWSKAMASAEKAYRQQEAYEAAALKRVKSPLTAPATDELVDWHRYLIQAFYRLDPDWEDGYPATKVIPLSSAKNFELLSGYVGDALTDGLNGDSAIMIASPSQDVLLDVLAKQATRAKASSLATTRIYVAVDNQHVEAAGKALAHTGATFIQIDINKAIPQPNERLERYLKNSSEPEDD